MSNPSPLEGLTVSIDPPAYRLTEAFPSPEALQRVFDEAQQPRGYAQLLTDLPRLTSLCLQACVGAPNWHKAMRPCVPPNSIKLFQIQNDICALVRSAEADSQAIDQLIPDIRKLLDAYLCHPANFCDLKDANDSLNELLNIVYRGVRPAAALMVEL
jgi:hypothetical protein